MIVPNSIDEAINLFRSKKLKPSDLLDYYLKNIERKNNLNAVLETFNEAKEQAKLADLAYENNQARILEGIPYLTKDCILVKDHTGSAGSKMLEKFVSPYDATVTALLRDAGAICFGRTNMDEFALGASGEKSAYGKTLNPLDYSRTPGGTSSGSAAAVAADLCLFALGTDTGGSVRQPASFCGLYGYKPSYGGFSRFGLVAAASSLEGVGTITKCAKDSKILKDVLFKYDKLDSTSIPDSLRLERESKLFSKTICYPRSFIEAEGVSDAVKENFYSYLNKLKEIGYKVNEVELKSFSYGVSAYYIINPAEVSTNLSRMDGLRFGGGDVASVNNYQELFSKNRGKFLGSEVKRRIILGTFVLSHGYYDAFYSKAVKVRHAMKKELSKVFSENSILLMPTFPSTATKFGENKDAKTEYAEDMFTVPANLTGICGISLPSGLDENKMPFGIQALSDFACDNNLFEFAKDFDTLKN